MKTRYILPILTSIALLFLLFTCRMDTFAPPPASAGLPADKVLDVSRSYDSSFTYETLLPVALDLTVQLYDQANPTAALARQAVEEQLIVVSLRNSRGQPLYTGSIPSGGTLQTVLALPAAPEDVVLRLEAPGYQTREVTIDSMVLLAEVNRVMGLLSDGLAAREVLPDADGDGVPDVYDADPRNPAVTFVNKIPAEGFLSVAFEDLYLKEDAGDADYNDFLAKYRVSEYAATSTTLSSMVIEAEAVAKLAGYNHDFGMVIDFGEGVADATIEYYSSTGPLLKTRELTNLQGKAVLPLFESTKDCLGRTTKAVLTFHEPVERDTITLPPYDPYLYVRDTKYDIHLIGRESLPGSSNPPGSTFQDLKGYPWALLVPIDWQHPAETQYIGSAYPLFDRWRESFGQEVPSWYLFPASVNTKPGNRPPYPVTASQSDVTIEIGASTNMMLGIDTPEPSGLPDPDGDPVTFHSSQLPRCIQLDSAKGLLLINAKTTPAQYVVYFWSMDPYGASTIDKPFRMTFTFQLKTSNTAPQVSFYDLQVGGAGTTAVNGYYRETGANEGWPLYDQVDGNYHLYYLTTTDFGSRWVIHGSIFAPNTATLGSVTYHAGDLTGTWSRTVNGATPPPTVGRAAITGTLASGNVLTGTYNYSDAEGDADASTYQWKKYGSATDTSGGENCGGAGATTLSYKVDTSDVGQFLRLEVTPRDVRGASGDPVLSGSVRIN